MERRRNPATTGNRTIVSNSRSQMAGLVWVGLMSVGLMRVGLVWAAKEQRVTRRVMAGSEGY
ncbi:hypothetical protein LR48_Vigan617s000100 [Vigna angularis]|uniref:Uncharacterized protein n=1 Tax=Phaseolus angularis TaxID=3914 RepID=A0A0L9TEE9_PHAAN|nr:hypothetical protein LR48_Vigan617s000100 [Vigna angularis]